MDKEKLRKIDELVAIKVMGWHRKVLPGGGGGGGFTAYVDEEGKIQKFSEHPPINFCSCEVFSPSTDISDAWRVVEKLKDSGFHVSIKMPPKGKSDSCWVSVKDYYVGKYYVAYAVKTTLAICLAALKAVCVDTAKI